MALMDNIYRLKKQKKAIILAYNYQRRGVQDIADYVGDSIAFLGMTQSQNNQEHK